MATPHANLRRSAPARRPALTPHQQQVAERILEDVVRRKREQVTLGGYAGTGKTTLIRHLVGELRGWAVCAFTGKAANVLRRKGVEAGTIHSLIYEAVEDARGQITFRRRWELPCRGIIVDEASMVGEEIYRDLRAFSLPLIFVGDHGQLEPVGSRLNLMEAPDYTLEEVHRHAGDVAAFAEAIRKGWPLERFRDSPSVRFVARDELDDGTLLAADQVICAYNRTRVALNAHLRAARGYDGPVQAGERVMCLRNRRQEGLFNGMQGTVAELRRVDRRDVMDFRCDHRVLHNLWYDPSQFGRERYEFAFGRDTPNPFDWAYALTCHKAQGDEWDTVLVIEQRGRAWDHRRWAYTAASRAREQVVWVPAAAG
jgi:exodeoxyribonuclease-5